ncbi:transposase [Sphingomonas sp. ERG5]|uniref:transposase n=1 Tax=Sphingomonas sp. ERG5 TaxID=1381597 RepID=UPI00228625EC|nr:transposase [Sphingomonas sp. ERG5]
MADATAAWRSAAIALATTGTSRGDGLHTRRKYQRSYDRIAYKQRWGIEAFFARIKQWCRIATRCDKLADSFLGFVKLASIMLWLK